MDFSDFCHIQVSLPKSSEEVYLMSTGTAPSSFVILRNGLTTNNVLAYKGTITEETIQTWKQEEFNVELSESLFMEEIRKALIGSDSFDFEVNYRRGRATKMSLINHMDVNDPKTILEADLEEIKVSEGLIALSRTGVNSLKVSKQAAATTAEIERLRADNKRLQTLLEDLTVAKNKWEDSHYRAFTKILNAKKRRIGELEGVPYQKQRKSKKVKVQVDSDAEEDEMNTSDENAGNSSEDYDRDTEIDESPSPSTVTREERDTESEDNSRDEQVQSTSNNGNQFKKVVVLEDDDEESRNESNNHNKVLSKAMEDTLPSKHAVSASTSTAASRTRTTFQNNLALDSDTGSETEFNEPPTDSPLPLTSTATPSSGLSQKPKSSTSENQRVEILETGTGGRTNNQTPKSSASSETGDELDADDF